MLECIHYHKYHSTLLSVLVYFIPVILTSIMYVMILRIATKQRKAIQYLQPAHLKNEQKRIRKTMRAFLTMGCAIIYISFLIVRSLKCSDIVDTWDTPLMLNEVMIEIIG